MDAKPVAIRPILDRDLDALLRFRLEPGLIGPNWYGHRDSGELARRLQQDGWLGEDDSRMTVTVDDEPAGFVAWAKVSQGNGCYWGIGISLLPEYRGHGVGSAAQRLLCAYLFEHSAAPRIEAVTQPENVVEQRILERLGFRHEGTLRSAEFRGGCWRDVMIYGLLRDDFSTAVRRRSAGSRRSS
ncbi:MULTISPECIES: GNAT family protein [unclassified Solwaraspora]|uniref:GNAT family N-acetyltransferase n=1 Tax=unclassified Solwaraspora TaxID=2627926 RepID=UPI00248B4D0A|nr:MULTISPECIES: GNAT family protein [unclassified Solwaraspora]WBB96661.1 GNAT family protein [Solwaraspora sp. WMMA2059]WBC19435.1 GNAT family protein [Solwaraspora sp. WMMA2080]WJK32982.1 GNAT family protein [Solwaraspora sp. WMMA2065]